MEELIQQCEHCLVLPQEHCCEKCGKVLCNHCIYNTYCGHGTRGDMYHKSMQDEQEKSGTTGEEELIGEEMEALQTESLRDIIAGFVCINEFGWWSADRKNMIRFRREHRRIMREMLRGVRDMLHSHPAPSIEKARVLHPLVDIIDFA